MMDVLLYIFEFYQDSVSTCVPLWRDRAHAGKPAIEGDYHEAQAGCCAAGYIQDDPKLARNNSWPLMEFLIKSKRRHDDANQQVRHSIAKISGIRSSEQEITCKMQCI
jgi:hypothetical protein